MAHTTMQTDTPPVLVRVLKSFAGTLKTSTPYQAQEGKYMEMDSRDAADAERRGFVEFAYRKRERDKSIR